MAFLIARLAEIENRQDITDNQGQIVAAEIKFKLLENRDLFIGGDSQGTTNQTIELASDTLTITLGPPQDFTPKKMKIVLKDTTVISPKDTAMIGDTLNPLLLELSLYLGQEKQLDPVIVHGLTLLLPMIHVKPGAVAEDKMELIKSAAAGYLAGVASGQAFMSRIAAEDGKMAFMPPGME